MDHHEAFDAIRLVFHSDIPDTLLRDVLEKAIKNHKDEMALRRSATDAGTETSGEDLENRKKG
ncbi:MAG: hypothetical protein WB460_14200 [Candidatus Acidiferrales bacterium]